MAKQPEGPFEQTQSATIAKGASKRLYYGVFSTAPRKIRLSDETFVGLGSRYSVKWYEGLKAKKSADITKKMLGNGFKFETTEASTQDYFTAKVSCGVVSPRVDPSGELLIRLQALTGDDEPAAHLLAGHLELADVLLRQRGVVVLGRNAHHELAGRRHAARHVAADHEAHPAEHLALGQALRASKARRARGRRIPRRRPRRGD